MLLTYEFSKAILKEYEYCRKVMNKHFNKNLIMSEEEEHLFQQSNSCWICKKLIDDDEEKVRDHCHLTGKFRGAVHRNCKFDVKINVIPNGLEKYMAFFFE